MRNRIESSIDEFKAAVQEKLNKGERFLYLRHRYEGEDKLILWSISIETDEQLNRHINEMEQNNFKVFKIEHDNGSLCRFSVIE